jgi:uncharacterized phage protein gp47/JayE
MATIEDPDRPTLTGEDLDRIRARMAARVNLGVDPRSPAFLDAIVGSIFGDLEGPAALELDQFYDFAEVVARAIIPASSFGVWLDDWAESLGIERNDAAFAGGTVTFTGANGSTIAPGQQVTTTTGPDDDPIAFQVDSPGGTIGVSGTLDLPVTAVEAGSVGNVAAGTITIPSPAVTGVTAVSNAAAMTGGADVEDDERLNQRVREQLSAELGSGTIASYVSLSKDQAPGVGFVTVRPHARGPGTVDVYITDLNNDPMPPGAVAALQAILDPVTQQGRGLAPIGHDVLVLTPTGFPVTVTATITHETGYSLTGAGGTIATHATIEAAIRRYIDGLDVGDDVVRNKVVAAIVDVTGVANVTTTGGSALAVNGATTETVAVPATEVAVSSTITLA